MKKIVNTVILLALLPLNIAWCLVQVCVALVVLALSNLIDIWTDVR